VDRQTASPSRVGLTGLETVVRLGVDQRSAQPFSARIDCIVEPGLAQASRFEEVIRDVVRELVVRAAGMRAERLAAAGFSEPDIARVLEGVPVPSHDQLSIGTLHLGCPEDCALELDVAALLEIIEGAMSSEIFELMKRSDEAAVVERAHRRPRAIDDCVRAMLAGVVGRFPDLPDAAFASAAQESTETIRRHHLTAERAGRLGELRRELRTGEPVVPRTSMRRWLEA
jgi:GTP cyclohydrolase IV